jgi:pyridoxine kinase
VATSIPAGEKLTTAVFAKDHATTVTRPKLPDVPHGTGDLFSGLLAARLALGHSLDDSLGFAVAATEHVIAVSAGTASLDLAAGLKNIASVQGFAVSHE